MRERLLAAAIVVAAMLAILGAISLAAGTFSANEESTQAASSKEIDPGNGQGFGRAKQAKDPEEDASGKGALRNAAAIATRFDVSHDRVLALHKNGIGYGAMVKLFELAVVKGISVEDLVASLPKNSAGKLEPNFDQLFASLSPAQQAELNKSGVKNLGQLKRQKPKNSRAR